jgi:hypothetical protein
MDRSSDHSNLATALAEARPTPREDFAKELDERVAAGFPRRSRLSGTPLSLLRDHLLASGPGRLLFAGGGIVLATIAVATVILAGGGSGTEQHPSGGLLDEVSRFSGSSESSESPSQPIEPQTANSGRDAPQYESAIPRRESEAGPSRSVAPTGSIAGAAETGARAHREIERSAEIGLLADPSDVANDSAAVFAAVHDANGIVLHSTTTSWKRAGANFDLLVPSAQLGDALAAFSAIDDVRTRHEATEDITAPTVDASEKLRDSRARIDGLLAQLAAAETETEMSVIEAELARERRHAASLRVQLDKLEKRTDFSRVSVRIETGGSSTDLGGAWGIGDAFDDAGHILSIAAGVTLIGLAVLGPLALIALLAWLAHRTWVRAQRRRALRDA